MLNNQLRAIALNSLISVPVFTFYFFQTNLSHFLSVNGSKDKRCTAVLKFMCTWLGFDKTWIVYKIRTMKFLTKTSKGITTDK